LGLDPIDLFKLKSALAKPNAPKVIWIHGAACSGCSVSLLNRVALSAPVSTAAVLTDDIDLVYHPTLMAAAGSMAADAALQAADSGKFILVVEGGVPTKFDGACCWIWTRNDEEVTFQSMVRNLAGRASSVVAVGTCAAFGGVPASGENPAGVVPVSTATNKPTINVPGCPAHPDWIVWTLAKVIANGNDIPLDAHGRPIELYGNTVHDKCPRRTAFSGGTNAREFGEDSENCLIRLGCLGPSTHAPCPTTRWNANSVTGEGVNWCVDSNAPCLACTEPKFPNLGAGDFYNI
jgi:hydrogenase small subunit